MTAPKNGTVLESPALWICGRCGREIVLPEGVPVDQVMELHRLACSPLQPRKVVHA